MNLIKNVISIFLTGVGTVFGFWGVLVIILAKIGKHPDRIENESHRKHLSTYKGKKELLRVSIMFGSISFIIFCICYRKMLYKSFSIMLFVNIIIYLFLSCIHLSNKYKEQIYLNIDNSNINVLFSSIFIILITYNNFIFTIFLMIGLLIMLIMTLFINKYWTHSELSSFNKTNYVMIGATLFMGLNTINLISVKSAIIIIFISWISYIILDFYNYKRNKDIYNPQISLFNSLSIVIGILELSNIRNISIILVISVLIIIGIVTIIQYIFYIWRSNLIKKSINNYGVSILISIFLIIIGILNMFNVSNKYNEIYISTLIFLSLGITLYRVIKKRTMDNMINIINIVLIVALFGEKYILIGIVLIDMIGIIFVFLRVREYLKYSN